MLRIEITPVARDDLLAIHEFVSRDSPNAADRLCEELLSAIESLASFSRRFPVAEESTAWKAEIRSMVVFRYRVLYSVQQRRVVIIRIVHGHMRPQQPRK